MDSPSPLIVVREYIAALDAVRHVGPGCHLRLKGAARVATVKSRAATLLAAEKALRALVSP